jgi:hypothetical protein
VIFAIGLAISILALDLVTPLGVAGGVPYVALVLTGWWFPRRSHIFILSLLSSSLVGVGYIFAPEGGVAWVVLINRAYALLAIWITALVVSAGKASEIVREKQASETLSFLEDEAKKVKIALLELEGKITYFKEKYFEALAYCLRQKSDNLPLNTAI